MTIGPLIWLGLGNDDNTLDMVNRPRIWWLTDLREECCVLLGYWPLRCKPTDDMYAEAVNSQAECGISPEDLSLIPFADSAWTSLVYIQQFLTCHLVFGGRLLSPFWILCWNWQAWASFTKEQSIHWRLFSWKRCVLNEVVSFCRHTA